MTIHVKEKRWHRSVFIDMERFSWPTVFKKKDYRTVYTMSTHFCKEYIWVNKYICRKKPKVLMMVISGYWGYMTIKLKKQINWVKDWNRHFTKETMPISTWKMCPAPLSSRRCKQKPQWDATTDSTARWQGCRNENAHLWLAGMGDCATTLKIGLAVSHKVKYTPTLWPSKCPFRYLPGEMKTLDIGKTCVWMFIAALFITLNTPERKSDFKKF